MTFLRCLGLVGAPGVELTTHCARLIDEEVRQRFGGSQRANLVTLSLQIGSLESPLHRNNRQKDGHAVGEAMQMVQSLGAEAVLLCSSLLHVMSRESIGVPVLSITAPVVGAIRRARHQRVGLVGTRAAKEERFWRDALAEAGIEEVLLPVTCDREHLLKVVDEEFANGIVTEAARADVVRVVHSLRRAGARAVVVCLPVLTAVLEDAVPVTPIFDVTQLYAQAAVDWMLVSATTGHAAN